MELGRKYKDLALFVRCSNARFGILLAAPFEVCRVRMFAVVIELPRDSALGHHHLGSLRMISDLSFLHDRHLSDDNIAMLCFCMTIGARKQCKHIAIIREEVRIISEIQAMLSITLDTLDDCSAESSWRSVLITDRRKGISAIWKMEQFRNCNLIVYLHRKCGSRHVCRYLFPVV